tara:strand:- start:1119 stop:2252 length:1134 start_codon:yes stop_codon:yes gene_type:complete
MALCVAMLISSEFMPVSLLTPMAADLATSEGVTGQAVSISGLFAVLTSLLITPLAGRFDRRTVLVGLAVVMLASLVLIALAPTIAVLMTARALLGITIGGFWALATAVVMRLVPADQVARALGVVYTGNAFATAFAAPIGSFLGGLIGWRGVFWALVPLALINLAWLWLALPHLPSSADRRSVGDVLGLLARRNVAFAMLGVMLTFGGAFCTFTYMRPFLETYGSVDVNQLSLLLLGLGIAGFPGTYGTSALANRYLYRLLWLLPLLLSGMTLILLGVGHVLWATGLALIVWGGLNAAIPVAWSTWLSQGISDEPESGGGLLVAAIQASIMTGGALGGALLDHLSIAATLIGGAGLLVCAVGVTGRASRLQPPTKAG